MDKNVEMIERSNAKKGETKNKLLHKVRLKYEENKKDLFIFGIILLFCVLICSPLIQFHIASDTYNLMDLGYFEYPSQYFLKDARIVSTLVMYIAGILNLPYSVFIVMMEILAIIIVSFSIYFIYKTVSEKIKLKSNGKIILVIMAGFILLFNCMSLEYLLYAECSVMCLSVLLSILAARTFTSDSKHKYIKALLLIIMATFCYQGAVNIFLPLTILFIFIDKNQKSKKEIVKQVVLSGVWICIAYIVNVLSIYVINTILGGEQSRIAGGILTNLSLFGVLINYIITNTLIYNYNLWPMGITLIFIAITLIILLFQKKTTEKILNYIVILLSALLICIVPIFFMKSPSMEPRMAMSIGGIIGMSLIYLITLEQKNKILEYIISILVVSFFIFNSVNAIQIFSSHIATNKIDANMGMTIRYKIEEYERESGNTVTKVAYYRDENHKDFHYGWDKKLSSFGQRAFDNYYCIIEALNYYCDRKFEKAQMTKEVYNEYFAGRDWVAYSDEQIVFDGDTMYICTY